MAQSIGPALTAAAAAGTIRTPCRASGRPVAYLLSAVVDHCLHVVQVTVSPSDARRRLGAALVEHHAAVALAEGRPALAALAAHEAAMIPGDAPRVAMRRPLGSRRI